MSNTYICPKCKSTHTVKDKSFAGSETGDRKCENCGYMAPTHKFISKESRD